MKLQEKDQIVFTRVLNREAEVIGDKARDIKSSLKWLLEVFDDYERYVIKYATYIHTVLDELIEPEDKLLNTIGWIRDDFVSLEQKVDLFLHDEPVFSHFIEKFKVLVEKYQSVDIKRDYMIFKEMLGDHKDSVINKTDYKKILNHTRQMFRTVKTLWGELDYLNDTLIEFRCKSKDFRNVKYKENY